MAELSPYALRLALYLALMLLFGRMLFVRPGLPRSVSLGLTFVALVLVGIDAVTRLSGVLGISPVDIDGETAVQSTIEVSTPIEAAYFEAWKQHFGERGVLKTRYTFHAKKVSVTMEGKEIEIPNIKYEVDIFRTETGERSRWCKIDVEIDSLLDFLDRKGISFDDVEMVVKVTHLPFKPEQCFLHSAGNEQHDQSVKKFWDAFQLKKKESNNGR